MFEWLSTADGTEFARAVNILLNTLTVLLLGLVQRSVRHPNGGTSAPPAHPPDGAGETPPNDRSPEAGI